jgi:IMP dehydrogenase
MPNSHIQDFMDLFPGQGLTFDDVSLCTQYADFLPEEASVSSQFSRNVGLKIPFVSAAMDTVTEGSMAIAMALAGGIGVVHKNLSPRKQAREVERVKFHLNGLIASPIVFRDDTPISEIQSVRKRKNYSFAGFPIIDDQERLCGILTSRDVKFLSQHEVPVREVMTRDLVTAPVGTTLRKAYEMMIARKVGKLPLVDRDGRLAGLYSFHDVKSLIEHNEPQINRDEDHRLRVAAAISPYDEERIALLTNAGVDALVVDTAHGHSKGVIETVAQVKAQHPDVDVVAGNIADGEAARALLNAGVDAVKVGIGPGSICTTRVVAGVGIPQLTAIYRVAKVVGDEVPIIADGGIKQSGDVPKALAVGGSAVMMGSALAGTQESPGEKILHQGRRYVVYRGMGSVEAMQANEGSRRRYSHPDTASTDDLVPQGIEGLVAFRGSVNNVLTQFVGGLRFSLGYCGSRNLRELKAKAKFLRVSGAGLREAHPHDIKIIKDAPNYRSGDQ